jgi:hypothetical protein
MQNVACYTQIIREESDPSQVDTVISVWCGNVVLASIPQRIIFGDLLIQDVFVRLNLVIPKAGHIQCRIDLIGVGAQPNAYTFIGSLALPPANAQ